MKDWTKMNTTEKSDIFNTYFALEENIIKPFQSNPTFNSDLANKINASVNESYRDYLILYLLDKKYTIKDGFQFFNAGNILIPDSDIYSIMAEKLNLSFDQIIGFYFSDFNRKNNMTPFQNEKQAVRNDIKKLSEDIRTRIEIFVEVHNIEYQKENPEKYIELLNAPITSLLSIKLSKNEKLNKALKERIQKARKN